MLRLLPLLSLLGSFCTLSAPSGAQSTVFYNGRIWTGDANLPRVTALWVTGTRVAAIGSDAAMLAQAGRGAYRIDLGGRRMLPGLIDSHVHLLGGGGELLAPDLRSATSEEDFSRRLAAAARKLPKGTWLTTGSWDHEAWPGAQLPTRKVLDKHVPDHPVFVYRTDGHMAVANSAALRRAKIRKETPAPAGGVIVRDASGEPAGVFKDTAMLLVSRHIPALDQAQRRRRIMAALRHAARLGITTVHDMLDDLRPLQSYQQLARVGALSCRVRVYAPIVSRQTWANLRLASGFGSAMLRFQGFKAFADGSLGSTTAWFDAPYSDAPDHRGLPMPAMLEGGRMPDDIATATAAGMQLAIHAIGDRANAAILDLYGDQEARLRLLRPRIEHAQHLRAADIPRFRKLGVVASMQPYHAIDDGRWAEKRIGPQRAARTYAFRSLLDAGATLAFGSDWPVAPLSPWWGLYAAVTRKTLDGKHPGGWVPEQKIEVQEALRAYTMGSAIAGHDDAELGSLSPGKFADLVVLDRDPIMIPAGELKDVQVVLTMVGGRVVYEREESISAGLRPALSGRQAWQAAPANYRRMRPHRVRRITIHHSGVDLQGWPRVNAVKQMRSLQRWAQQERNWGDTPYHFSIAPNGRILVGRDFHCAGSTSTRYDPGGHLMIEVMGDMSKRQPTAAQLRSLERLSAWACRRFGVNPQDIHGHLRHARTACPGVNLQKRISSGELARAVRAILAR